VPKGQKGPTGSIETSQNSTFDRVEKLILLFFDSFFLVINISASFCTAKVNY